jgi:hypothetical protein
MANIVLAEQNNIDTYEIIGIHFFSAIFNMDWYEILVTDESRLSDFRFCGMEDNQENLDYLTLNQQYELWDDFVTKKIMDRYNVDINDVSTKVLLVDLFELIKTSLALVKH